MIQRIQTLYLLAIVALGIALIFLPVLQLVTPEEAAELQIFELSALGGVPLQGLWGLLVTTALIPLLALIDIFLYKNLQRQMTVCFVDIIIGLAMLVAIGIQAFVVGNREGWTVSWQWYVLLPVLSIIFLMMAHKAMSRDKKKLLDADRLR